MESNAANVITVVTEHMMQGGVGSKASSDDGDSDSDKSEDMQSNES